MLHVFLGEYTQLCIFKADHPDDGEFHKKFGHDELKLGYQVIPN